MPKSKGGTIISVRMKRGGYMPARVRGRAYNDSDGAGDRWTQVELDSIEFLGGGQIPDKWIADMSQVEEAYLNVLKKEQETSEVDAYEVRREAYAY